jgi:hypothetical protein
MVAALAACESMDLKPIGLQIMADEVLASADAPIKIRFGCAMAQAETECIVSVRSIRGNADVDRRWEAETLVLTPVQGWWPGVVYTVVVSGVMRTADGREEQVSEYAAFHYGSADDVPYVVSYYPEDGAQTGVREKDGAFVTVYFSHPMDESSVQDAFTINGFSDKAYAWNDERTMFTVTNKKNIAPLETYRWTLAATAKSADGFLLDGEVSAQWTSDAETVKPLVFRVYPVVQKENDYEWSETGNPIEAGLGDGEAVEIEFTKRMDTASLSVQFEPPLSGSIEIIDASKIVFIPEWDPAVDTYDTMTISGEAKDEYGLTMDEDYVVQFTPDAAHLEVTITVSGKSVVNGGRINIEIDPDEAEFDIMITFNQDFLGENLTDCISQIKLINLFPMEAPLPVLTYTDCTGARLFNQVWSKLYDGKTHDFPHYYKYVIPGGQNGITNGAGAYLKEDHIFFINAVDEES